MFLIDTRLRLSSLRLDFEGSFQMFVRKYLQRHFGRCVRNGGGVGPKGLDGSGPELAWAVGGWEGGVAEVSGCVGGRCGRGCGGGPWRWRWRCPLETMFDAGVSMPRQQQ